jgi:hypothetical protein
MRCPPIRFRRPGSGCPAVRCPVTWGRRPEGAAVGRLLSTRPLSTRPVSAPSVRTRPSPPMLRRWRWGPGRGGRATVTTGTGGDPGGHRAGDGSTAEEAGTRATLPKSPWSQWEVGGGPGLPVGCGPRRPRLTTERPGRPGRRSGRPSRPAALWARVQTAARGGCTRAWRRSSGWVRDHGAWSSPSLTAGWAAPEGPLEVPAGDGRAAPARPKPAASAPSSVLAAL